MCFFWDANLNFQHHFSSLRCHMIPYKSEINMLICCSRNIYIHWNKHIHWYLCLNITTSTTLIDQIPGGVIECYYIKLSVSLCVYRMIVTVWMSLETSFKSTLNETRLESMQIKVWPLRSALPIHKDSSIYIYIYIHEHGQQNWVAQLYLLQ